MTAMASEPAPRPCVDESAPRVLEIHVACPDLSVAESLASALVDSRVAACTSAIPDMSSRYWWDGAIEVDREVLLVVKTRPELFDAVLECVDEHHPDDVPSVLGRLVDFVNHDYATWVATTTATPDR